MIKNPKNGWCDFRIGDFRATPSYITNVPIDLLDCFINYFTNRQSVCWFDCETEEFTLVLTPYSSFIIQEVEETFLYRISTPIVDLAKELIRDIESNSDWNNWDKEMYKNQAENIKQRINQLKAVKYTQNNILH